MKRTIVIVGASLFLAACSHTPTDADIQKQLEQERLTREAQQTNDVATQDGTAEAASIEIANFAFAPKTLTVKPGTVIRVTNRDIASHTMTSDDDTSFNTPLIGKDQTVEVTAPMTPGTYDFHCTPHPNMKGTLIVGGQ